MTEPEMRIIKKYPNRRLYDTTISSYITLEDVRRLVLEQIPIKVIDARTQNDITHSTLLQIIIEQEESGPSLFSTNSLQQMIRSYGTTIQQMMSHVFEQGMEFISHQHNESMGKEHKDPLKWMTEFTQKNIVHWQKLQQDWFLRFVHPADQKDPNDPNELDAAQENNA